MIAYRYASILVRSKFDRDYVTLWHNARIPRLRHSRERRDRLGRTDSGTRALPRMLN